MTWFVKRPGRKNMAELIVCPACGVKNRIRSEIRGVPLCGKCKKPLPLAQKPPVRILTTENFESSTRLNPQPVLVDFWASWCMPCKMMAPVLDKFVAAHASIILAKVDIDAEPGLASQFQIFSVPTLVMFVKGCEVHRVSGAISESELETNFGPWLGKK
jgi:thioredoxin 2